MEIQRKRLNKIEVEYSLNGVRAILRDCRHGRRTHGYGHRGYQYGHVLTIFINGKIQGHGESLRSGTYRGWIKGIVEALAGEPRQCPYCHRLSFFYQRTWTTKSRSGYVSTRYLECERCHRPDYGDWEHQGKWFTRAVSLRPDVYPDYYLNTRPIPKHRALVATT